MEDLRPMISNISFYIKDEQENKKVIKDFSELEFNTPLYFDFTLSGINEIPTHKKIYITILYYDKVQTPRRLPLVPEYQLNEVWQETIINTSSEYIDYSLKLTDLSFAYGLRNYDFSENYQNLKIIYTDHQIDFQNINSKELLSLMKHINKHDLFHTKVSMIPRVKGHQNE
ncbi:hypothetical protein MUA34_05435 [Staphylococcus delphini]|uniref:hypothetical protein n=1 Tax=Staphylococcus delphini TaxID=53344 RepID=UPI0021D15354|nr:hypothetical protein [Staphylococcus delphini]UXS37839.1 hypothetical protein MUA34_05435 [Staphylococcus delphini]